MAHHLERQIGQLKARLLEMSESVERNVASAMEAFRTADADAAWAVIAADAEIDGREIELIEECLHALALYQPVASDMRLVVAVITIAKDLERIGDLSVSLAEQALLVAEHPPAGEAPIDLTAQCEMALTMVRQSLSAMEHLDGGLARRVIYDDEQANSIHRGVCEEVKAAVVRNPRCIDAMLNCLVASRQLERIARHAVNIAEDVIYTAEAEIVRHRQLAEPLRRGKS